MLSLLLASFGALASRGPDAAPLATRIQDVTVYGSTAHVRRVGRVERGGTFLVEGLPAALDPNNVRVKCSPGEVARVEVRTRLRANTPSERLQALRERLAGLRRELQRLQDEVALQTALRDGLAQLAEQDAVEHADELRRGAGGAAGWSARLRFLSERRAEVTRALRELSWKLEDQSAAVQALERELGRAEGAGNVTLHDVEVELLASSASTVEVEYFVGQTGWQPAYDVRAAKDLAQVELTYRARVWQETGEDWSDVALALSTAQPQRGAQGPEPVTTWIDVYDPKPRSGSVVSAPAAPPAEYERAASDVLHDAELADKNDAPAPRPFAAVENLGLSARFQLAQRETIESRRDPTTVLVGAASFPIAPERFCTPALDTTVWLRAKLKNTSAWVLLPGSAAVFLGADYVGAARLETVQLEQEFTLHLGADPALAVTRTQIQDLSKGPAFLSNRASKVDAWRLTLENHGAARAAADGSVEVIVREVLPRSRDERVEISFTKTEPRWSDAARWKQEREDQGIHTWVLRVPKGGKSELVTQTTVTYPRGLELARN